MNGSIDSTATCLMLQEQGYEIVGVTMHVWEDEPQDTRELAERMGIRHYVADERIPFKEIIVKNLINEYKQGHTPNPCVMYNPLFRLRILTEWADRLNCAQVATGHHSRLEEKSRNIYIVAEDSDKKDQSCLLWRLGQDVLKRCIFPLGDYTKVKVREHLAERGYKAKSKEGEGTKVCFVKGGYRDFFREQCPKLDSEIEPGWFVSSEGVKSGRHKEAPYYTTRRRKELEIALEKPVYVLKANPQKNTVMLRNADQLETEYMLAEQDKIVDERELFGCGNLTARTRYRNRPISCRVKRSEDGRLLIHFLETASTIAPGRSAVFYDGKRVLGGVFIASQGGIGLVVMGNEEL